MYLNMAKCVTNTATTDEIRNCTHSAQIQYQHAQSLTHNKFDSFQSSIYGGLKDCRLEANNEHKINKNVTVDEMYSECMSKVVDSQITKIPFILKDLEKEIDLLM